MTKLRGYIPTMLMLVTLIFGATAANAGIIVNGRDGGDSLTTSSTTSDPCAEEETSLVGIIVNGFSAARSFFKDGIIVNGRSSSSEEFCGIIVNG